MNAVFDHVCDQNLTVHVLSAVSFLWLMRQVNGKNRKLMEHYRDCYPASVAVRPATLVTCRCYELRCQTGVVAGNYSSGNTLVPYAIAPSELEPVYQFQTVSNELPTDSFGRVFPGNVLNSSQLLFTDCWNTTDSLVWTQSLHRCGICTAAGMQAGAGAQSVKSVPSCPVHMHMHVFKKAWATRLSCLLYIHNMVASQ